MSGTGGPGTTGAILLLVGLLLGCAGGLLLGVLWARARTDSRASRAQAQLATLAAERDGARAEAVRMRDERDAQAARAGASDGELAAARALVEAERAASAERVEQHRAEQARTAERFQALSAEALRLNSETFLTLADERFKTAQQSHAGELEQRRQAIEGMVAPLRETLGRVEGQLRELEQARLKAYTSLTEQVGFVRATSEQLRVETASLVTALRAPQARGRWGEVQLRRVVEMAGMVEHVDFDEQVSVMTADGTVRPDLVVRMAGGKNVVVDAKVTLAAYLEAAETADPAVRADRLAAHARHLRRHVDELAGKAYWRHLTPTPEFVVLFVPGEAFLAPALEYEPTLLEHAMSQRVIIATPTTLMTLLRTVAYTWQQAALTDNAREVFDLGRELYERLGRLGEHVDKLGRSISRVVGDYNAAVGSLETRVLVTARKLSDLTIVRTVLPGPTPVDDATRAISAGPLLESIEEARTLRALPLDDVEADPRYGVDPAVDERGSGARRASDGA